MKAKILVLGLIFYLAPLLVAEKKRQINPWQKLFPDHVERVYIIMKDWTTFPYSNQDETRVNMRIGMLEKRLKKFKDKNYSIKEIAVIIHNHRRKNYFTYADYKQYRMLKKYGFNGLFLLYCHRASKVYNIEKKDEKDTY